MVVVEDGMVVVVVVEDGMVVVVGAVVTVVVVVVEVVVVEEEDVEVVVEDVVVVIGEGLMYIHAHPPLMTPLPHTLIPIPVDGTELAPHGLPPHWYTPNPGWEFMVVKT